MTLDPIGYPWRGDAYVKHRDMQELLRRVRKPLRVDETMTMTETPGGTILGVRQSDKPQTAIVRWFRILSDEELYDKTAGAEQYNELKCRSNAECPQEDSPSIYGVWVDGDDSVTCTLAEKEEAATKIYFPTQYVTCLVQVEDNGQQQCGTNKWIGEIVLAWYNPETERWESDSEPNELYDRVDFVKFCGDRTAIARCGSGGCPDPLSPETNYKCCIFDGIARRDKESCRYECGAENDVEDCWIICTDITSLPAGQECFPARRISDAYTLAYCPKGLPTSSQGGPMINETRPVYVIGCCGCGCPATKVTLEFHFGYYTNGQWNANNGCQFEGKKVTVPLSIIPCPGEINSPNTCYEGYFCLTYNNVPRFVMETDLQPENSTLSQIWVEPDPLTGHIAGLWINEGDCCYTPYNGAIVPQKSNLNGYIDPLIPKVGGQCLNPEDVLRTTARFCYRVRMRCTADGTVEMWMQLCLPPGHPAYAGTPQEDINAPLENLIQLAGSDIQSLTPWGPKCDGRKWFRMEPHFGDIQIPDFNDPEYMANPQFQSHVFGGCCWDPAVLGSAATCYGDTPVNNTCSCCYAEGSPEWDDCIAGKNGRTCDTEVFIKATWDCRNDSSTWITPA